MRAQLFYLFAITLLTVVVPVTNANAEQKNEKIVVVVNKANPTDRINTKQLVDLYMGKLVAFPNGEKAQPLDLNRDANLRINFYQALTKRPITQVNAYWARVKYSGRAVPPISLSSSQEVINQINSDTSAIGYLAVSDVTDDVKVIYTLDK